MNIFGVRIDTKQFFIGVIVAYAVLLVPKVGSWLFEQIGKIRKSIGSK